MKDIRAAKHGGTQNSVTRIVIHGTVSPCQRGGAVNVAHYFQTPGAGGSAHYVVDPGEVVRCLAETTVAYHAPPNTGTIGVELCDPQKGAASRWGDDDHEAMLRLAADLVRRIAQRWDVPLRRLTVADVKAGKRGICGHVDVSKAFHQSDHTDPGDAFPWGHFMALVCGETPKAAKPAPTPAKSEPEETMPEIVSLGLEDHIVVPAGVDYQPWWTAEWKDTAGWHPAGGQSIAPTVDVWADLTAHVTLTGLVPGEAVRVGLTRHLADGTVVDIAWPNGQLSVVHADADGRAEVDLNGHVKLSATTRGRVTVRHDSVNEVTLDQSSLFKGILHRYQ
nr:peptidoglycan recognition family protein [Microbispora sp. CL1-1]